MYYSQALDSLFREFPDARFVEKKSSFFMRVIDVCLRIITLGAMRRFMTNFVTVVGSTVYLPTSWDERTPTQKAVSIHHEMVHLRQRRRYGGFFFTLRYLCWPLPTIYALGRLRLEQEAYEETLRTWVRFRGQTVLEDADLREHIVSHFTSASYFWTYPFKRELEVWYNQTVKKLKTEIKV